jgi:hypothetical protein
MVRGPAAGLELLNALDEDGRLAGHHRLDAVRAHLLEMSGDDAAAIAHYRIAAGRTTSLPERNYLITQAARLRQSTTNPAPDDSAWSSECGLSCTHATDPTRASWFAAP